MITENDDRLYTSKYQDEFKQVALDALNHMKENFMDYATEPDVRGYTYRFSPYTIRDEFDDLIIKHGFEIDATSIRHAYGIGNNNEWDIVDINMDKVGEFFATDNMYQGCILGVRIKGRTIMSFTMCSGGFIRE